MITRVGIEKIEIFEANDRADVHDEEYFLSISRFAFQYKKNFSSMNFFLVAKWKLRGSVDSAFKTQNK